MTRRPPGGPTPPGRRPNSARQTGVEGRCRSRPTGAGRRRRTRCRTRRGSRGRGSRRRPTSRSRSPARPPRRRTVVDDDGDVAAPRVEVLPDEQPAVAGGGHRLGRGPPVHVPQVVAGDVLAQRVEGQVAHGRPRRSRRPRGRGAGRCPASSSGTIGGRTRISTTSVHDVARRAVPVGRRAAGGRPDGDHAAALGRMLKLSSWASSEPGPRVVRCTMPRRGARARRGSGAVVAMLRTHAGGHRADPRPRARAAHHVDPARVRPTRNGSGEQEDQQAGGASTASSRQSGDAARRRGRTPPPAPSTPAG